MMRSTLGAPLGGTTRGGHHGLESRALRLMVPPNGSGGFGRYLPSIVVVALGDPGAPVVGWAGALPSCGAASARPFNRKCPVAAQYPSSPPAARAARASNLVLLNTSISLQGALHGWMKSPRPTRPRADRMRPETVYQ